MYPSMSPNWLFCIVGKLQTLNTENLSWNLFGIVFPQNFSFSLKKKCSDFLSFSKYAAWWHLSTIHSFGGPAKSNIPFDRGHRVHSDKIVTIPEPKTWPCTSDLQQSVTFAWLLKSNHCGSWLVGSTLSICAPLPDAQALQLIMIATKCTKGAILMHCFFTTPPPLHCSSAIVKYQMWNRKCKIQNTKCQKICEILMHCFFTTPPPVHHCSAIAKKKSPANFSRCICNQVICILRSAQ